jgi:hypothetical protein
MSLAQELLGTSNCLITRRINEALDNHSVEEIVQFIRSSEDFDEFWIYGPPDNEEFGRHISDAIVENSHIKTLHYANRSGEIRDLVAWIGSRDTLVNMTSLETVSVYARDDMSVLDCHALFPLLLTSKSLRKFDIRFLRDNGCSDAVMSALLSYLSAASLREFVFHFYSRGLSEAALTALCDGVALSTVRDFWLRTSFFNELNLQTAAESLAQMILESSLEEVEIEGGVFIPWRAESLISALKLTAPVQNMDFAFTVTEISMLQWNLTLLTIN